MAYLYIYSISFCISNRKKSCLITWRTNSDVKNVLRIPIKFRPISQWDSMEVKGRGSVKNAMYSFSGTILSCAKHNSLVAMQLSGLSWVIPDVSYRMVQNTIHWLHLLSNTTCTIFYFSKKKKKFLVHGGRQN